jgi:hypothetical protein
MNIQMPVQNFNPPFGAGAAQMPQQFQMMQMLLSMVMNLLSQFQQGGAGMSQGNPSFGGGCSRGTSPGGVGGAPGFGSFGGNGFQPGRGQTSGPGRTSGPVDSYVPSGSNSTGQVGDLGNGQGGDAVRWALSHEGVSESNNPGMVRQFSRGRWQPWCADFVSQAYANSPGGSPFGHQSSVAGILAWGRQNNKFFDTGAAQRNPGMLKPGDIAVWKSDGRSHVGLVTGINPNGTFNTIEGNTSNAVRRRTHPFGRGLTGFVRPRG